MLHTLEVQPSLTLHLSGTVTFEGHHLNALGLAEAEALSGGARQPHKGSLNRICRYCTFADLIANESGHVYGRVRNEALGRTRPLDKTYRRIGLPMDGMVK